MNLSFLNVLKREELIIRYIMQEDLYIFGSGGFAREVYYLALRTQQYNIKAFVDEHKKDALILSNIYIPVISEVEFLEIIDKKKVNVGIAIGDNNIVKKIVEKFQTKCIFPNLIDPSVIFVDKGSIGDGNIICYGNYISCNFKMGSFNRINYLCKFGHDCLIGDYNQINPNSTISGNVRIGSLNLLGASSNIIQNITIGDNNIIGLGAVLLTNVDCDGRYVGNPARKMVF